MTNSAGAIHTSMTTATLVKSTYETRKKGIFA